MKRITAFTTADGQVFLIEHDAKRHAEDRFGNALTALAHAAVLQDKYIMMGDFIERNLPRFVELAALQRDCKLEETIGDDQ